MLRRIRKTFFSEIALSICYSPGRGDQMRKKNIIILEMLP